MLALGKDSCATRSWNYNFQFCNIDIFTNPIPPFNAQIRIQKKLKGIMRFSEGLKIEILGALFRYFARFFVIWACL